MKNHAIILAVITLLLGVYFILHAFLPVLSDQLQAVALTVEEVFTTLSVAVGILTVLSYYFFGKKHRLLGMLIGLVMVLMGGLIFFKPTFGTLIFNTLIIALLAASGLFKLLQLKRITSRRLTLVTALSGMISLIVATVITLYFFKTAKYELLAFLALDISVSGVVLWHLAFHDKATS